MRFLISVLIFILAINFGHAKDAKLSVGQAVPEQLGVDLAGNKVLSADHLGKVIVISFWATWCPPCRKELPIIDNLQKLAGKDRMTVVAVNFGEPKRTFRKFTDLLPNANLTFTHDNKGKIGKKDLGVEGIPHMVIVDQSGKVAHIHVGYGDETVENLANEINALFRQKS